VQERVARWLHPQETAPDPEALPAIQD
jgi:hypothetical protein